MSYYQIILRFWICLSIIFSPIILINSANAATVGGWDLKNPVAQGASTVYDATKNVVINGKKYIKESSVKITPTATSVAKVLARGAAGYALSVAVEQLLGSVDWVLDPANNQIKYKPKADPQTCSGYQHLDTAQIFCSAQALVDYQKEKHNWYSSVLTSVNVRGKYADIYFCYKEKQSNSSCHTSDITTRVITGTDDTQEQTIPLPVVASQVISNAENGDTSAQAATTAAAADIVAEAENDNTKARPIASQAEANATTKPADAAEAEKANEATGTSQPNTANPDATDLSLTFPLFCNWAPTICEAAQTVISFPQTLTNWWETATTQVKDWATSISEAWIATKEWFKSEPEQETELTDPPDPIQVTDTEFHFDSSCPAPMTLANFSYHGHQQNWEVDFSGLCSSLETFVKPVVIAMGALTAVYIVSGTRDD